MTELKRLDRLSEEVSQFTVLMGRRRTGKTTLMTRSFEGKPYLYFFIGKKAEAIQCMEFQRQMEEVLGIHIHGQVTELATLLQEVMFYSQRQQVTVIIDEFQRLADIDAFAYFIQHKRNNDLAGNGARMVAGDKHYVFLAAGKLAKSGRADGGEHSAAYKFCFARLRRIMMYARYENSVYALLVKAQLFI